MKFNKYIDQTLLKPEAKKLEIINLAKEALLYDFATVCVNPCHVQDVYQILKDSTVGITTVIGFPLGANSTETKIFEAENALAHGVTEIDVVMNIGALKEGNYQLVLSELQQIRRVTKNHCLKVILETCLLNDEEIVRACQLAVQAQVDFVKTSTGFSKSGATVAAVQLMKQTVGNQAQVKASGGIRSLEDAQKMIAAGATRLGTSSGVALVSGQAIAEAY